MNQPSLLWVVIGRQKPTRHCPSELNVATHRVDRDGVVTHRPRAARQGAATRKLRGHTNGRRRGTPPDRSRRSASGTRPDRLHRAEPGEVPEATGLRCGPSPHAPQGRATAHSADHREGQHGDWSVSYPSVGRPRTTTRLATVQPPGGRAPATRGIPRSCPSRPLPRPVQAASGTGFRRPKVTARSTTS